MGGRTDVDVVGKVVTNGTHGERFIRTLETCRLRHAVKIIALAPLHLPDLREQQGPVINRLFDQRVGLEGIRHHATVIPVQIRQVERLPKKLRRNIFPEFQFDIGLAQHTETFLSPFQQQGAVLVVRAMGPLRGVQCGVEFEAITPPARVVSQPTTISQRLAVMCDFPLAIEIVDARLQQQLRITPERRRRLETLFQSGKHRRHSDLIRVRLLHGAALIFDGGRCGLISGNVLWRCSPGTGCKRNRGKPQDQAIIPELFVEQLVHRGPVIDSSWHRQSVTPVKENNSPELPVAYPFPHFWLQAGARRGTCTGTEQCHQISRHLGMEIEVFVPRDLVAADG